MSEEEAPLPPAPVAGEDDEADLLLEEPKPDKPVYMIRASAEAAEAAALPRIKVAGDGKRMHLVSQQFIDVLESRPRFRVPGRLSDERLLRSVGGDEAKYAILIKGYEAMESLRDMELGILQQYHDMGYAYFEIAGDADEV